MRRLTSAAICRKEVQCKYMCVCVCMCVRALCDAPMLSCRTNAAVACSITPVLSMPSPANFFLH
jgi:hypothetical protein